MPDERPHACYSEETILHLKRHLRGEGWLAAFRLHSQGDSEIWLLPLSRTRDCADGLEVQTTTGQCLSVCMGSGLFADIEVVTESSWQ